MTLKTNLSLLAGFLLTGIAFGQPSPTQLLNRGTVPGVSGGGGSYAPRFSEDGRWVVFTSRARNLVTNDNSNDRLNIYARDLNSGSTLLVSINNSGIGGGNGNSFNPSISSNGQFIAFESSASDLVINDSNGTVDIFVRDLVDGTTSLISLSVNGPTSANGASRTPIITPDGNFVAFESAASDLVSGDANLISDLFLRDIHAGVTYRVSEGAQVAAVPVSRSGAASISSDGARVVFASTANVFGTKPNSMGEIYVRDIPGAATIWVSTNVYSSSGPKSLSLNPSMDAAGRYIAFKTIFGADQANPLATNLYQHDLVTGTTSLIRSNVLDEDLPEMTVDGRFVAYESGTNVFLWDRNSGSNTLVNVATSGIPANGVSYRPVLSMDGSKVLFLSDADNLTASGGDGQVHLYIRDLTHSTTELISGRPGGGLGQGVSGIVPDLSPDGSKAIFESRDDLLVLNDENRESDVFLRDLGAATTTLISRRDASLESASSPGYLTVLPRCLSADNRLFVFSSLDGTYVTGDHNGLEDAFIRDLAAGTNALLGPLSSTVTTRAPVISANGRIATYLRKDLSDPIPYEQIYVRDFDSHTNFPVTVAWNSANPANGNSSAVTLSSNATFIAFQSEASNLVSNDVNGLPDVFVKNLTNGITLLASVNAAGTSSANNRSASPMISPNGRWVAFRTLASDVGTDANGAWQLVARDLQLFTTVLLSADSGGAPLAGDSGAVTITHNGLVLFTNANAGFLYNLADASRTLVCSNCTNPAISADGRWLVYESIVGTNQTLDIVLKDLNAGTTNIVSITSDGTSAGNGSSRHPVVSANGRFIAFSSRASNLVDNDANDRSDIFVHDRVLSRTFIASANMSGNSSGDGPSVTPILAADGRTIVFQSFAPNIVPHDFNHRPDTLFLTLGAADSDGDGMDDDWEVAFFGNLARDGSLDFDHDGHSDLQEFIAGTDPTNSGSILRVFRLTSLTGTTTVFWNAVSGKRYRVEYKDTLGSGSWSALAGFTTASGSTASRLDDSGSVSSNRFYRVVLAP